MLPQHKAAKNLQIATDIIFALCFGAVLLRLLVSGAEYINDMPAEPNNWLSLGVALLWAAVLLAAAWGMRRFAASCASRFFTAWYGVGLAFVALLCAQLVIALYCYTPCGWDPQVLITTANDLLAGVPYEGTYFHQNPNNLFLLGCYRYFFAFLNRFGITDYLPWAVAVGVVLVNLSVLFLFLLVRRLFGMRAAWLSFLLCAPIAGLSPWIAVPYSDTYGMPFAIGSLFCYISAREAKQPRMRMLWAALCGVWLALGARIKPTVLLLVAAVALVELLCACGQAVRGIAIGRKNRKSAQMAERIAPDEVIACSAAVLLTEGTTNQSSCLAVSQQGTAPQLFAERSPKRQGAAAEPLRTAARKTALGIVMAFLVGAVLSYGAAGWFQQRAAGDVLDPVRAEQESFSATHYFMMGLSQPQGSYAYEDMQFTESIKGRQEKTQANLAEAARRLREMGASGYASFLWRKLNFSWDDGTFFFGREGSFYWGAAPQQSPFAKVMQSVFRADGAHYAALAVWQQAQWLLLLILMLLGLLYRRGPHAKWIWLARICTLGLVCFLLLFEARSRYVYHFLPVLCFAATGGIFVLQGALKKRLPAQEIKISHNENAETRGD